MSVVLWPRQEVLQLVIHQLGNVGKGLNQYNAFFAINKLSELQDKNHKLSYNNWLSVAKGSLKWNDHCINLFWEMLATAMTYLHPEQVCSKREEMTIDIECVVVFLAMHITDSSTTKPATPKVVFEAVWPLNENGEVYPSSPVASPSSPVRDVRNRSSSPHSSPMSPRSPRNSPQKPSSPRTSSAATTRTPRASTQHLHSIRQKIPIILRALNSSDTENVVTADGEESVKLDFRIGCRVVDALGLVLCGGQSRDQTVSPLSSLHPTWCGEGEPARDSLLPAHEFVSWVNLHLSMNDLLYPALQTPALLDTLDEAGKDAGGKSHQPQRVYFPLGSLSRFSPTVISTANANTVIHIATSNYSRNSSFRTRYGDKQAFRASAADLQEYIDGEVDLTTLDLGSATTADAIAETGDAAPSTGASSPVKPLAAADLSSSFFEDVGDIRTSGSGSGMGLGGGLISFSGVVGESGHEVRAKDKADLALPQLFLSYCNRSKLYMLCPYYSATVTGCTDCEVVIGAVYGAVIVNGCERVRITVACRRLVIINCLECDFQVATLSPTIISGDCRALSVGPYNVNYRNLRQHLRCTDLAPLMHSGTASVASLTAPLSLSSGGGNGATGELPPNVWSSLCDVNICLDVAGTGASVAQSMDRLISCSTTTTTTATPMSAMGVYELPAPLSITAVIQPVDKFHALVVPVKSELVPWDATPVYIPREFKLQVLAQRQAVDDTKHALLQLIRTSQTTAGSDKDDVLAGESTSSKSVMTPDQESREELDAKLLSSSLLAKRFMEWMVSTDSIQEVLDLIRLDSEKQPSTFHPL